MTTLGKGSVIFLFFFYISGIYLLSLQAVIREFVTTFIFTMILFV
jgi:hypothetical protein